MIETSDLLFQTVLAASLLALVFYGLFFVRQREKIRTLARRTLLAAGILQTLYILFRYLQSGYTPITTQHETIVFFAWSVTWAYLSFRWRYTVKNFGTFISLLLFLLLLIAAGASRAIIPLPPALQSWWLPVHAGISVISYGFLALAFCSGIMYLLQEHELKSKRFGYFFTRLPSLDSLDQLNSHCLATGFILFTLGIITGSIWARQAWGNLLALGPERDLVADHLVSLCRPDPSAFFRRLARQTGSGHGRYRFWCSPLYPLGRNVSARRGSQLCPVT